MLLTLATKSTTRSLLLRQTTLLRSTFSTTPPTSITTPTDDDEPNPAINPNLIDERSPAQIKVEKQDTYESEPNRIWGITAPTPDPLLPATPSELSALDPAHYTDPASLGDGRGRKVTIRQMWRNPSQSPEIHEQRWIISFNDDGAVSKNWKNPLMGWVSSADPMASNMGLQMFFRNAKEAVYFAKKRGWVYDVERPILRQMRHDGAQYQDNFLPQRIAALVRRDATKCDHWHRPEAGASHYNRPLKYHGDGIVAQYGPNPDAEVAPHVEGKYKMR
jgi:NADH dehydrogenase (ubiquinone) Fe-S protein 4